MTQEERNKLYLESFRLSQKEAGEALKARDEAQERLDLANSACLAWKTIVDQAGLSKNGSGPVATPSDSAINKAEFVRSAIESSGWFGTTPAEVKAAAIKAGIKAYAGYPYTVIHRLREQKKVKENDKGRLVMVKPPA